MPEFDDHVLQAKRNLSFLQKINDQIEDCFDWQVTVCYYAALHLINAHTAKFGLQYRKHVDVIDAINPMHRLSPTKLPEDEYVAYIALQSLSRRARYLVNVKDKQLCSEKVQYIYEKHLVNLSDIWIV
jgi:uncharacterized protein (UPF0332 family)